MDTVRIRDPGWKKVGSGIRDKHPGSATLENCLKFETVKPGLKETCSGGILIMLVILLLLLLEDKSDLYTRLEEEQRVSWIQVQDTCLFIMF
jgi:hypothetical protein